MGHLALVAGLAGLFFTGAPLSQEDPPAPTDGSVPVPHNHKPPIIISNGSLDVATEVEIYNGVSAPNGRWKHFTSYPRIGCARVVNSDGWILWPGDGTERVVKLWLEDLAGAPDLVVEGRADLQLDAGKKLKSRAKRGKKFVRYWEDEMVEIRKVEILDGNDVVVFAAESSEDEETQISWVLIWSHPQGCSTPPAQARGH
jgi:hypothetical protein